MLGFHDFVHEQKEKNEENVINQFVKNLKSKASLIYFDEFQVTNIVDAMILGKLFEQIFKEDIKIILTSNTEISELYKEGLQREQFIPFIKIMEDQSIEHELKIEDDLRVFPASNSSSDVIDCLRKSALSKNVEILTKFFVKEISKTPDNKFNIFSLKKEKVTSKNIILSTGGNPSGYKLAQNLGHNIVKPVPSLFTFSTKEQNLDECSGVSIKGIDIEIKLNNKNFQNRGDLLITHWGFSGPAVLKLSSIAARELYSQKYKFNLIIKWSALGYEELKEKVNYLRLNKGKVNLINCRPLPKLTKRLWIFLLNKIGIDKEKKWADLLADEREKMINILQRDKYIISGKGPFGEEFVTSGGVKINEVNFKSMESLICPGLFFSGEVLDVDGITGGFNFQHCWTSGWIAGMAVSKLNN